MFTDYYSRLNELGIVLASDASHGEVRAECPECVGSQKQTLPINMDTGAFYCHRCMEFKGNLGSNGKHVAVNPVKRTQRDSTALARQEALDRINAAKIARIMAEALPLSDPAAAPAYRYLISNRLCGNELKPLPDNLYGVEWLSYGKRADSPEYPAMIQVIHSPDGEPVGLNRLYLTTSGQKANVWKAKLLVGPIRKYAYRGGAIRLFPAGEDLVLCEGVENALSLHAELGIPAWSCISANGLAQVEVPPYVRRVVIGADNDISGTGQLVGQRLRKRLLSAGFQVELMMPPNVGEDWNDIYRRIHGP